MKTNRITLLIVLAITSILLPLSSAHGFVVDSLNKSRNVKILPAIPSGLPYSFTRAPFINPRIINDLSTWLSDGGNQVVEISLDGSQESNRYFGEIIHEARDNGYPFVSIKDERDTSFQWPVYFEYQYIGTTENGVHVLLTRDCPGGRGVFINLMLVKVISDIDYGYNDELNRVSEWRQSVSIRKIVEVPLGDRWHGTLEVKGNKIYIGENTNERPGYQAAEVVDVNIPESKTTIIYK